MISIITIVRNDASRIEATLRSVLDQKKQGVEYLVIDGASTDGTMDSVEKYRGEIDVVVSERDDGIYQALNKGIRLASGSLIGLVHSGDVLLPGVLERIAEEHAKTPDSILYGCIKAIRGGRFESIWGWNHESLPEHMLPHPACFVPKSVYAEFGAYDESFRIAGDYEAFLRFYTRGVRFRFLDLIVQVFDLEGISQTRDSSAEKRRIRDRYELDAGERPEALIRKGLEYLLRKAYRGIKIVFKP